SRADALLRQLENRALLPEVLVRDVEQLVPEVELDIGARHSHGEREAGRGAVGLSRLDTRAGRGEKRAVAAPEVDLEAEVERLAGAERLRLKSRRALPPAALDAARESRGEGQRKYHGELAWSHGFGPVEKPLFSPRARPLSIIRPR